MGADVTGEGGVLRDALFRHLLLCELAEMISGGLPDGLASAWQRPNAAQLQRAIDTLARLRSTKTGYDVYRRFAEGGDEVCHSADRMRAPALGWQRCRRGS